MRISSSQLHRQSLAAILDQQVRLARTQNQLSSGLQWSRAGEDPAGFAAAQGLDQLVADTARFQANAENARHRLAIEEDALAEGIGVLQQVRERVIQGNSPALNAEGRASVAAELRGLREQMLAIANRDDGQGRYIFAGSADGLQPFSWTGSSASYAGDEQVRRAQISAQRSIPEGDSGVDVFMRLKTGNADFAVTAEAANTGVAQLRGAQLTDASQWDGGSYQVEFGAGTYEVRDAGNAVVQSGTYTAGTAIRVRGMELAFSGAPAAGDRFQITPSAPQDVLALLEKLASAIESPGATPAERAQQQTALQQRLAELSGAENQFSTIRAGVGTRMVAVDDAVSTISAQQLHAQEALSGLRDLDYAEAASRLQQEYVALQAAQQSYQRVQGLSLFDYLR